MNHNLQTFQTTHRHFRSFPAADRIPLLYLCVSLRHRRCQMGDVHGLGRSDGSGILPWTSLPTISTHRIDQHVHVPTRKPGISFVLQHQLPPMEPSRKRRSQLLAQSVVPWTGTFVGSKDVPTVKSGRQPPGLDAEDKIYFGINPH